MVRVCRPLWAFVFALAGLCGVASFAQDASAPKSLILTIDSDRVYASSLAGQRITKEIEDGLKALVAENRRIEAELEAEEKSLTEKRKTMETSEFRVLADEFDQRVRRIRSEQDAKQQELQRLRDEERRAFVQVIAPVLTTIGNERGAIIILERRDVLLSADSIDITDEAIARINAGATQPTSPQGENVIEQNPTETPVPNNGAGD